MRALAGICAAFLAMTQIMGQASPAAEGPLRPVFEVDRNWPKQLPNGYVFGPTGGVAVDSKGHVWVYSRPTQLRLTLMNPPNPTSGQAAPAVVELTADGTFVQGWGGALAMSESERAKFDWPVQEHGIAVDTKGNVWVCGNGRDARLGRDDDQCLKFTRDGKFLMQIGKSGKSKGSLDTENLGHPSRPVLASRPLPQTQTLPAVSTAIPCSCTGQSNLVRSL